MIRKRLPNLLTVSRIILSFTLLLTAPLSTAFLLLYALCGVTDMLDGFLARRWKVQTVLGSRLDTLADMTMIAVTLTLLWTRLPLTAIALGWFAVVGVVKCVSIGVWLRRTGRLLAHHSGLNKAVGLLLFLYPFVLTVWVSSWGIYMLLAVASIAALEELYRVCKENRE